MATSVDWEAIPTPPATSRLCDGKHDHAALQREKASTIVGILEMQGVPSYSQVRKLAVVISLII